MLKTIEFKGPIYADKSVTVDIKLTVEKAVADLLDVPFSEIDLLKVNNINQIDDDNFTFSRTMDKSGFKQNSNGEIGILKSPKSGRALYVYGDMLVDGSIIGAQFNQTSNQLNTNTFKSIDDKGIIIKDKTGKAVIIMKDGPKLGLFASPNPNAMFTTSGNGLISGDLEIVGTSNLIGKVFTPKIQSDQQFLLLAANNQKGIKIDASMIEVEKDFLVDGAVKVNKFKAVDSSGIEFQNTSANLVLVITDVGNVGINISDPEEKMHVSNNMIISGNLYVD